LANAHAGDRRVDVGEDAVAIVEEKPWSLVVGERLAELLRRPCGGRMRSDGQMRQATPVQRQDDQYEQQAVSHRLHDEEIGGHDLGAVIREEGPPSR
jgi:hypothetical protein